MGSARVFRYQHVCIGNTKSLRGGSKPTRSPKATGFALQWNIGLTLKLLFPQVLKPRACKHQEIDYFSEI